MDSTNPQEQNWLERMHGLISWKIVAPEINNPFKPPPSDKVLKELSEDRNVLKKYIKIRGILDGDEILVISDLQNFKMETSHPNLSKMTKADIKKYFEKSGTKEKLDKEIEAIQNSYREELTRRQKGVKQHSDLV